MPDEKQTISKLRFVNKAVLRTCAVVVIPNHGPGAADSANGRRNACRRVDRSNYAFWSSRVAMVASSIRAGSYYDSVPARGAIS
jgi:hypothetical protein